MGIQDILNVIHSHNDAVEVMTAAVSTIWFALHTLPLVLLGLYWYRTLSAVDNILDRLVDDGGITLMLVALRNHLKVRSI